MSERGSSPPLVLTLRPGVYAVARLDPGAPIPDWADRVGPELRSVTRTHAELSIVAPADEVPSEVRAERGWRLLEVAGPLDFGQTGILSGLTAPLAEAGVAVFVVSTFDTDLLLVREAQLDRAVAALRAAGHVVSLRPPPASAGSHSG